MKIEKTLKHNRNIEVENHLVAILDNNSENQNAEIIGDHEIEEVNVLVLKNEDETYTLFCSMPLYSYPNIDEDPDMSCNVILMNVDAKWQQPYDRLDKKISSYESPEDWRKTGWLIELIGSVYMMTFYYGEDCSEDSDVYDGIARGNFKYYFGGADNYAFENTDFYSYVVIETNETMEVEDEDGDEDKTIKTAYVFPVYKNEYKALMEDKSKFKKIAELYPNFIVDPSRPEILFDEDE